MFNITLRHTSSFPHFFNPISESFFVNASMFSSMRKLPIASGVYVRRSLNCQWTALRTRWAR
jgi:hypothetical protein